MSKTFRNYFNFSHPLIAQYLNPDECAWAYGMNVFDLRAWRKANIRDTYHSWLKENLNANLTMWKLGTLPPALIAFKAMFTQLTHIGICLVWGIRIRPILKA
ncbi:putative galacturonosyltransferase 13 [Bienertia sinuspersici]